MQIRKLAVIAFSSAVACSAAAYPRHDPNVYDGGNLWSITFHDDDSVGHTQWATQRICFQPYTLPGAGQTQIKGVWYSTTYPNWHGHYRQEGDSVKMVGNFWTGRGNDGITFDIVTSNVHTDLVDVHRTIGAGHWHEWGDNGRFGPVYGFGNALLQRVGRCHILSSISGVAAASAKTAAATAVEEEINVPPRLLEDGTEAQYPQQEGQLPLSGANYLEDLF